MSSTNRRTVEAVQLGNRLVLALDVRWLELNGNRPLVFDIEFEKKELVLRASLESGSLNTDQSERIDYTR